MGGPKKAINRKKTTAPKTATKKANGTNGSIAIEKGMKLPPVTRGARQSRYPFAAMSVGDAFPCPEGVDPKNLSTSAHSYGKRADMKFSVRMVPDKGRHYCFRVA